MLTDVGNFFHHSRIALFGEGIHANPDRLSGTYFGNVNLVHIGFGEHIAQIGQGGDYQVPSAYGRTDAAFFTAPVPEINDHTVTGGIDGEIVKYLTKLVQLPFFTVQFNKYIVNASLGLVYLKVVIAERLLVGAESLFQVVLVLSLRCRRFIDGLFHGNLGFFNIETLVFNIIPEGS